MKILGIIPAREGSKRVPKKNFRPFFNTTLTDLAIQHALESKLITNIVLSTDSKEILDIGKKYKQVFLLKRPNDIAQDSSPAIEYVRHCLKVVEAKKGIQFDIVVIIQPSSPFRSGKDIDATIDLLLNNPKFDSAVSVSKVKHDVHPLKFKVMNESELLPYIQEEKGRFSAEQLPEVYVRNCAVYVTWRKYLETRSDVIGNRSLGYIMSAESSIDINDLYDFEIAEYLFKKFAI